MLASGSLGLFGQVTSLREQVGELKGHGNNLGDDYTRLARDYRRIANALDTLSKRRDGGWCSGGHRLAGGLSRRNRIADRHYQATARQISTTGVTCAGGQQGLEFPGSSPLEAIPTAARRPFRLLNQLLNWARLVRNVIDGRAYRLAGP